MRSPRRRPHVRWPLANDLGALEQDDALITGRLTASALRVMMIATCVVAISLLSIHLEASPMIAGMLTLGGLSLLIGATTGERNYFLIAWLACLMAIGNANPAVEAADIFPEGLPDPSRPIFASFPQALIALLTLLILSRRIGTANPRSAPGWLIQSLRSLVVMMLVAASLLDVRIALPFISMMQVIGALILFIVCLRIASSTSSPTARLYLASMTFVLAGALAQAAEWVGWLPVRLQPFHLQATAFAWLIALGCALAAEVRITTRSKADAETQALEQMRRLQAHRQLAPAGLFSLDRHGCLTDCNRAFLSLFGFEDRQDSCFKPHWDALMGDGAFASLRKQNSPDNAVDREICVRSTARGERWYRVRMAFDGDAIEGAIEDITDRKREEATTRQLAERDQLTGLLNRRGLEHELTLAFERARAGALVAVAYIDFDRFKLVNDLFGHAAGDAVLKDSAFRMSLAIGANNRIARMGGDEFVLILHDVTLADATRTCEQVLASLRDRPFTHEEKAFNIEASIGLTMVDPSLSMAEVIGFADRSCSAAKKLGGSRLLAFESNDALVREHREETRLVSLLRDRIPFDRMTWHAQPIASIRHARANIAVEALLRMVGEDGQPIDAYRVVSAAERHGLMGTIDRWMLEEVLSWIESHPEVHDRLAFVNLNLSGASLNDERFVGNALALMRERSRAAGKLCIEITESVALYDFGNTRRLIDKVKQCGVLVALDDFGAGYTSFNYLRELPADLIKIDGGFVRLMAQDAPSRGITRMIIELAHELNMGCVAEAAESPEILRLLKGMKVDYAQGYAICPPVSPDVVLGAAHPHELIASPEIRQILRLPPVLRVA